MLLYCYTPLTITTDAAINEDGDALVTIQKTKKNNHKSKDQRQTNSKNPKTETH